MADRFADVAAVADAVLFEGYLLYPYRASAQKNQVRWQWGVLVPQGYGTDSGETSANRTECLLELREDAPTRSCTCGCATCTWNGAPCSTQAGRPLDALDVGRTGTSPSTRACPGTSTPRSPGPSC